MEKTNETHNVLIYIRNEYELYKMVQNVASSIEKKINKGIEIDIDKLAFSSVVGKILTYLNNYMKKYDDKNLSTEAKKESRYIIANEIIEQANENIDYKKELLTIKQ